MKKKFLKSAATMLTVCVGTMAASTAFATSVNTTTTYLYGSDAENVTVTTNVTAAGANSMIAYFVSRDVSTDVDASGKKIVFIDQKTADENGDATFNFVAKQADLFGTEKVTLKFGSNVTPTNPFPTFTFTKGINFISNGTADISNQAMLNDLTTEGEVGAMANVSGNVKEYGFYVSDGTTDAEGNPVRQKLRAYGSTEGTSYGTYAVIITGLKDTSNITFTPYTIAEDSTEKEWNSVSNSTTAE